MHHDDDLVQRALRLLTQPVERSQTIASSTQQKALDPIPTAHSGDQIEWHRADSLQHGTVNFVHVDADGLAWAFVTIGQSWAAVNLKCATVRTNADTRYPPMSPTLFAEWSDGA
jgi:hypothetical protein